MIQGPLAGFSNAPFRRLIWRYSQPAFTCTEMISCKTLIQNKPSLLKRFVTIAPDEGPVCFQLSGNDPKELGDAVKIVTQLGAHAIDLNCGCPVNKIRKKGAGSSLLSNPTLLAKLILAMKENTHLPVSIKIRVDGKTSDTYNQTMVNVINDTLPDKLIVHGRNWREHYETSCQYSEIEYFVKHCRVPVIGNGDIACITSLKEMLKTGCHDVMIARAGMGQPWLIAKLTAELNSETYIEPSLNEVANLFIEHISTLADLLENEKFAVIQARKFAKYYARNIEERKLFCDRINKAETIDAVKKLCGAFFR